MTSMKAIIEMMRVDSLKETNFLEEFAEHGGIEALREIEDVDEDENAELAHEVLESIREWDSNNQKRKWNCLVGTIRQYQEKSLYGWGTLLKEGLLADIVGAGCSIEVDAVSGYLGADCVLGVCNDELADATGLWWCPSDEAGPGACCGVSGFGMLEVEGVDCVGCIILREGGDELVVGRVVLTSSKEDDLGVVGVEAEDDEAGTVWLAERGTGFDSVVVEGDCVVASH